MKQLRWIGECAAVGLWVGVVAATAWGVEPKQVPLEMAAKATSPHCRCNGDGGPNVEHIRRVLGEPLMERGLEFSEEPLENVANFLQDEYGIPIQIDEPALEDAGLTCDEPLTIHVRNVSLKSALRLMMKRKQLTYIIQNEVLVITTPEEAETQFVACVYDVRDIVGRNQGNRNLAGLIDSIVKCVARETWAANGKGAAEIKPLQPGLLVISQTQAVHEEIHELLGLIRETLNNPVAGSRGAEMKTMPGLEREFGMGRGGNGMGMEGGRGGYGRGGMEGGRGGGYGGEMGGRGPMERQPEPTPAQDDLFGP